MNLHSHFKKTIWMYWENKRGCPKPPILDLCLETIQKHAGSFQIKLLNENSVNDYINIPEILRTYHPIAYKSDYIRFALLHKYGGIWLDSDLILLRTPDEIIGNYLKEGKFIIFKGMRGNYYNGGLAAACDTPAFHEALSLADYALKKNTLFTPLKAGTQLLRQKDFRLDGYIKALMQKSLFLGHNDLGGDILAKLVEKHPYHAHPLAKVW